MTRWKYDAERSHRLVPFRIPVTPGVPGHGYLVALHKESQQEPTWAEVEMIVSFIEFHRQSWYTTSERKALDREPFDICSGVNTVIFHKYAQNDWAYRRRMWEPHRLVPPSPRVSTRVVGPCTLPEIMDEVNAKNDCHRLWRLWKEEHPEVFGA